MGNKKCRIYAVFGVSQTPKIFVRERRESYWKSVRALDKETENNSKGGQQIEKTKETINNVLSNLSVGI